MSHSRKAIENKEKTNTFRTKYPKIYFEEKVDSRSDMTLSKWDYISDSLRIMS